MKYEKKSRGKKYTDTTISQRAEGFVGQKRIVLPPNIEQENILNPILKRFHLTAVGYYPNAGYHQKYRPRGSKDYILIYCLSGEGQIHVQSASYLLEPNTFFIIPKGIPHQYQSSEDNPWSIYWAHFNGDLAEPLYERQLDEEYQPAIHSVAYDEALVSIFEKICDMLEHSFSILQLEITNLNLLHFVSGLIYHKQIHHATYDNDSISKSISFMKNNLNVNLTLEDFATQQEFSTSHFARLFKQKMGLPPVQYFNQLRVQKSCQFLYFTDKSIKNICKDLGFEDQYYFSRLFKGLIGLSPANYRKSTKK